MRHTIFLIILMVITITCFAQNDINKQTVTTTFKNPRFFSIETGSKLEYLFRSSIDINGYKFVQPALSLDSFSKVKSSVVDLTYVHTAPKVSELKNALLTTETYSADIFVNTGFPVKPKITAEYSLINLYIYNNNTSKHFRGFYGGIGMSLNFPILYSTQVVGEIDYSFINKKGGSISLELEWVSPLIFNSDLHTVAGGNYKLAFYDWGETESYGIFLGLGVTF